MSSCPTCGSDTDNPAVLGRVQSLEILVVYEIGENQCGGSMDMRLGMVVATVIAGLGAPGMGDSRLRAQDAPTELTGCLDVTVGPWVVETYVGELHPRLSESLEWYRVPPRLMFAGPDDRNPSRTRIVVPEGDSDARRRRWTGGYIEDDSLRVFFSDGFTGVRATLGRSRGGWVGTARSFSDVIPHQVNIRPVAMSRVDCESPRPVPGDESHPLARVVELEGGQVMTLGEPLPEPLETETLPPFDWTEPPWPADWGPLTTPRNAVALVGRTRGLFGATDSVQVHTNTDGLVYSIRLLYADPAARESLEERLSSQYGAPGTRSGVPDVHIYRSASTSLWLRPSAAGAAEILLSDRGR